MSQRHQEITAIRFSIVIDGVNVATFSELSGIVSEVQEIDFWDATEDGPVIKKLGGNHMRPPTLTLRSAMSGALELWAWHQTVRTGSVIEARRSCTLVMVDEQGKPVATYWLENAWPSKIELTGLKGGPSEVLVETVHLNFDWAQRVG